MKMKYVTLLCIAGMVAASQAALVGYWDFEGASTSTLTDQSGNGNDATVHAGGTLLYSVDTPLFSGSSLLLDGTPNTAAEALNSDSLSITGSVSLVAWVKIEAAATNQVQFQILSKGASEYRWNVQDVHPSNGNFNQVSLVAADFDLQFNVGNIRTDWIHLAMVYDEVAQTKVFYRNGAAVGSFASTNALVGLNTVFQIGALQTNEFTAVFNVMHGLMDDVAVFDNALDVAQVGSLANGTKTPLDVLIPDAVEPTYENLVGYWDFEDTSTTILHDQSGRGNQAVAPLGGMLTYSNNTPFATGSSLSLDGINGWASASSSDSLAVTGSVSLVAWVKLPSSGAGAMELVSKHHTAYRWRMKDISYANGNFRQQAFIASTQQKLAFINGDLGNWMHLAMVYDEAAETISFYRNGVLENESPEASTNALLATDFTLSIGAFLNDSGAPSSVFNGLMDDVAIYSTVLTQAQILSLADGTETPITIVPAIVEAVLPPTIIGVTSVAGGIVEMTINAPSSAHRYSPEARASLVTGAWADTPHSDNAGGPFVVSNLSYSALDASGTNEIIYIEATNNAAFFQIIGE